MRVRAGSVHTHRGGCRAKIQEVMKHPQWSVRSSPDNDVALGRMDRLMDFNSKVSSIRLPDQAVKNPPIDDVEVLGWGAIQEDGIYQGYRKQQLQVYCSHLYSRRACNAVMKLYGAKITENFMCISQRGYKGPCTRDTGAPAVRGGILWGLASWGIRKSCGKDKYPAVFSYIGSSANLNFIKNGTSYFMNKNHFTRKLSAVTPKATTTSTRVFKVPGSYERQGSYTKTTVLHVSRETMYGKLGGIVFLGNHSKHVLKIK